MLMDIYLKNFRNYSELNISIPEGFTIFTGPNGSGKSNLLESIYYLGTGYSYRQHHDEALVNWGSNFFVVRGNIKVEGIFYKQEILYQLEKRRKIVKINGKREIPGKCSFYLPVVIFSPGDILLLQGPPVLRRRFLDLVVAQLKPQHAVDMHIYQSILIQRNNLLRQGITGEAELSPWDEQLIQSGSRILRRRLSVLTELNKISSAVLESIGGLTGLEGFYISQIIPTNASFFEGINEKIENLFRSALKKTGNIEKKLKVTAVGPHRDDICFYLRGREARYYCSQGEQRLITLALKVSHCKILSYKQKNEPLLLLDDVFSELDDNKRDQVFRHLRSVKQVIATATSYPNGGVFIKKELTPNVCMFNIGDVDKRVGFSAGQ